MDTAYIHFDDVKPGSLPPAWVCGVTGKGAPRWAVERDATAPSPPHVLKQSGSGTFPWCVKRDVAEENGFVEVKLKPLSGREDRQTPAPALVSAATVLLPILAAVVLVLAVITGEAGAQAVWHTG